LAVVIQRFPQPKRRYWRQSWQRAVVLAASRYYWQGPAAEVARQRCNVELPSGEVDQGGSEVSFASQIRRRFHEGHF